MIHLPNWSIFVATAVILWATVNILDKLLVAQYVDNKEFRLLFDSSIGILFAFVVYWFVPNTPQFIKLLGILSGILLCAFDYLYYRTIEIVSISKTSLLLLLVPVINAFIGYYYFNEKFHQSKYIAIGLIIIGSLPFYFKRANEKRNNWLSNKERSTLICFMFPGVILLCLIFGLYKFMLQSADILSVFYWNRIGAFLPIAIYFLFSENFRNSCYRLFKISSQQTKLMIIFVEWINLAGIYFVLCGFALGPLTLVTTIAGLQPIIIIAFSLPLSLKTDSKIKNENSFSRNYFSIKLVAIALMVIGIYIIVGL